MLVDLSISKLSHEWEVRHGVGDYWWLSLLRALTGGGSESGDGAAAQPKVDPKNVRWM